MVPRWPSEVSAATHLVSANASNTEPAELIAVFVADGGAEITSLLDRWSIQFGVRVGGPFPSKPPRQISAVFGVHG